MQSSLGEIRQKSLVAYSMLVLVWSIQLVILLSVIYSFIPIKLNSFVYTILPLYLDQVRPHRQLQFYTAYIFFGVIAQALGIIFLKKQLGNRGFAKDLWIFVLVQTGWLLVELTAAFKIFVFGSPLWAKWFLYVSLIACLLNTIFWPEAKRLSISVYHWLDDAAHVKKVKRWVDVLIVPFILFLIWPAGMTKLIAHIFVWDYFHNQDGIIMAPAWSYLHGLVIDHDVTSNYGVIVPVLFGTLAKIFGGFSYEKILWLIVIGTLFYYVAVWALIRTWLKSSLLAAFGLILAVKLQMFHWGILPVLFRYPSATPIRYLFDLIPIFLIYKHSIKGREIYLWLAAVTSGLMMAYMMEVGTYLTVGLYAYIFMLLTLPSTRKKYFHFPRDIRKIIGLAILPFISGFLLLWQVVGHWALTREFWSNFTEFAGLFLNNYSCLPYWDGLADKQFFAFCMGFIIPAVYILTIMIIGAFVYLEQIETSQMFIIYVCVYGMGIYHYFVYRSAVTSYYVVCIPFVLVICFWIKQILKPVAQQLRRIILSVLVLLTLGLLMTSYLFTYYPNVLNLGRLDLSPEVDYYKKEFTFQPDAALIDRLTSPDERVPLISSFEIKMLMEANRKPFLYCFFLIDSRPMEGNDFLDMSILTVDRMRKTLKQFEDAKPNFVFIEKKLYLGKLPAVYYQHFQTLTILIKYFEANYVPYDQGQYLMALKRR